MSPTRRTFLALAGAAGLSGCSLGSGPNERSPTPQPSPSATPETDPIQPLQEWDGYDPEWTSPEAAPTTAVTTETVVENLEVPWDFEFAPNGDLFISERVGRVVRIRDGSQKVVAAPDDVVNASAISAGDEGGWWATGGEDGLLGVATPRTYPNDPYVYVYYTYPDRDAPNGATNRVVRYDTTAKDVTASEEVIIDGIPGNNFHNGGRIAFGPRGYLWVCCGDGGRDTTAQDPASLGGKILRVTPEGRPAPGNPGFEDNRVFTMGHRNPQGVTWLPDGRALVTEHGPSARDEVNLLRGGDNYGWPEARVQEEYEASETFHRPLVNTGGRTWAPSGCTFYTGDGLDSWRNRLVIGCLHGQMVSVVTLAQEGRDVPPNADQSFEGWYDTAFAAVAHFTFEDELGRVRYVGQGPDGALYAITSNRDGRAEGDFPKENADRLVRIVAQ
jgi:glucose/arabinose dehydrogenase